MKVFAILCSIAVAFARPHQNIVQLAESVPDLSILVSAVVAADLADTLSRHHGYFGYTVFAPTNEAFNALPAGTLDELMKPENKNDLRELLLEHVLGQFVASYHFRNNSRFHTVAKTVLVSQVTRARDVLLAPVSADNVFSKVTAADNRASNGIVHIIDRVLVPTPQRPKPNLVELCESTPSLSILTAALVAADLTDTLSAMSEEFTVFAPTNDAFNALPAGVLDSLMKPENKQQLVDILTYHVLPAQVLSTDLSPFQAVTTVEGKLLHVTEFGGVVRVGPSLLSKDLKTVVAADNVATNGVAHIIDGVLSLPAANAGAQNLVEVCESTPSLSILTGALVGGDLIDTLSYHIESQKFTVFAPTNDAFNALPAGVLDSLMKPENKQQLVDILTYHVLPEQVLSTDLSPFQAVTTVEGKLLHVTEFGGVVRVGPSLLSKDLKTVVAADNVATNGVAHIIDGVLSLPPAALLV